MDNQEPSAKAANSAEESTEAGNEYVINDLQVLSFDALLARVEQLNMRIRPGANRHHLILELVRYYLQQGAAVRGSGVLEMNGNQGAIRWAAFNFRHCPEDILVPPALIRERGLSNGLLLEFSVQVQRDRDRHLVIDRLLTIEGKNADEWQPPTDFEKLTPLFPKERIYLESPDKASISARAVDLVAPLGKGQRGLLVAPPRAGKTMLLKAIAKAIRRNHPEIHLILLLVDERPEEVTDLRREIDCDIFSSTFDEPVARHVQLCELVADRAKRLVEHRRDVVILLDSITRMARGYNNLQPNKGRIMSGGVDAKALAKPRKFFGSARNVEEGGSLTILATALVETQSRMDDLIFEEFKGTGNMEVHLDRSIAEQRIYPAIQIVKSGTRREELLYHPDEYDRIVLLRRQLSELPAVEAAELLVKNIQYSESNAELLLGGLRDF